MNLTPGLDLVLVVIGTIIWAIRQEGKISHLEDKLHGTQRDVDDVRARHESLDSKIVHELASLKESVARIEGYLKAKTED
jgi:hypothetical protein